MEAKVSSTNLLSDDASTAAASSTATAAAADAAPPVVTPASVLEALKSQKEWAKALAFEHDGRIVATTVKPLDGEVDAFVKLFDKREQTIGAGIILLSEQYDVHRFHPPLIYGRRGDPALEEGEGIAVCRVERKSGKGGALFCLITYTYPTLSARAVPQLKEFCDNYLPLGHVPSATPRQMPQLSSAQAYDAAAPAEKRGAQPAIVQVTKKVDIDSSGRKTSSVHTTTAIVMRLRGSETVVLVTSSHCASLNSLGLARATPFITFSATKVSEKPGHGHSPLTTSTMHIPNE
ncbi:hypothetical protein FI667_g10721, partial [Globisporangium splendens]